MLQIFEYYGKVQGLRSNLASLPGWARFILFLFAIPGILALALSIFALVVSVAALLLLTVPVYRVLRGICGGRSGVTPAVEPDFQPQVSAGRRHVDVKIIE